MEYFLHDTLIGQIGIVAYGNKIKRIFLPHSSNLALVRKIKRDFPLVQENLNSSIAAACKIIDNIFSGKKTVTDFSNLHIEELTEFQMQVLKATAKIPRGETRSYGEIARQITKPGACRATGSALGQNPFPLLIPCHRVIRADSRVGEFSAPGGSSTKKHLLELERRR